MKRSLTLLLALAMLLMWCSLALAQSLNPNTTSGDVDITTTVNVTYTVTIPADNDIAFNSTETNIGNIALSGATLAPNHQITVAIAGISAAGAGALKHTNNVNTIAYTLKIDALATNTASFTANGSKAVTVEIAQAAWDAAPAGDYKDTITFTVSYAAITP